MTIFQALNTVFELDVEYLNIVKKHIEALFFINPPKKWREGTRGDIVLLPGFAETWVFFRTIGNGLNLLGYRIHTIGSLGRNFDSINVSVAKVKKFIESNHLQNIILLSHSKGGIIAKTLLDDPELSMIIKQSISIAVPYRGSFLGYTQILSLHEFTPTSTIIKEVNRLSVNNSKIINLYPKIDNHVIPNKNLLLEGANNICVNIIGHNRVLETKETFEKISACIA
jgi:hypothetical protein